MAKKYTTLKANAGITAALDSLDTVHSSLMNSQSLTPGLTKTALGFESDRPDANVEVGATLNNTFDVIVSSLRDAEDFMNVIEASVSHLQPESRTQAVDRALAAAANTFIAASDGREYLEHQSGEFKNSYDYTVGSVSKSSVSTENFIEASFDNFVSQSVMANALNAISRDEGIELFFPTHLLEASKQGVELELNREYLYDRTVRGNGKSGDKLVKTPLYKAIVDSSILENNKTEIVPDAAASKTDVQPLFVPVADWPNVAREVDGVIVETRPLLAGAGFQDLLGLSRRPNVNGELDETDVLEEAISLEATAIKVTVPAEGGGTTTFTTLVPANQCVFTESVTRQNSAEVVLNRELRISLTGATKAWKTGVTAETTLSLAEAFGKAAGDDVMITFTTRVTGNVNHETAEGNVSFSPIKIVSVEAGGEAIDLASGVGKAWVDAANVVAEGYVLKASASLANSRTLGRMLDTENSVRYLFPLEVRSPWSSRSPSNGRSGGGANVTALARVNRRASQAQAIRTLIAFEQQADMINAMSVEEAESAFPAAAIGVKPMVVTRDHDVSTELTVEMSSGNLDDLRAFILNAMTSVVDQLVLESGYLAALELYDGADAAFEVIAMTDFRISGLLMRSGDPRPLGHGRELRIGNTHEASLRDKIYISVRRTRSLEQVDELSFGTHPMKPALVFENGSFHHKGATTKLIQTQAIDATAVMCPLLGVITLAGVDGFYKKQQ